MKRLPFRAWLLLILLPLFATCAFGKDFLIGFFPQELFSKFRITQFDKAYERKNWFIDNSDLREPQNQSDGKLWGKFKHVFFENQPENAQERFILTLEKFERAKKKSATAKFLLALVRLWKMDFTGSLDLIKTGLRTRPKAINLLFLKGILYSQAFSIEKIGMQGPSRNDADKFSAFPGERCDYSREALLALNEAITNSPDHYEALLTRSLMFWELKIYPSAISDLSKIIGCSSKKGKPFFYALLARGALFSQLGKYQDSLADLDLASKYYSSDFGFSLLAIEEEKEKVLLKQRLKRD